jgi:hypothetical protein
MQEQETELITHYHTLCGYVSELPHQILSKSSKLLNPLRHPYGACVFPQQRYGPSARNYTQSAEQFFRAATLFHVPGSHQNTFSHTSCNWSSMSIRAPVHVWTLHVQSAS